MFFTLSDVKMAPKISMEQGLCGANILQICAGANLGHRFMNLLNMLDCNFETFCNFNFF